MAKKLHEADKSFVPEPQIVPEGEDAFADRRVESVPQTCPACKRDNIARRGWTPYRLTLGAPSVGCGNCGHVVYLTHMASIQVLA